MLTVLVRWLATASEPAQCIPRAGSVVREPLPVAPDAMHGAGEMLAVAGDDDVFVWASSRDRGGEDSPTPHDPLLRFSAKEQRAGKRCPFAPSWHCASRAWSGRHIASWC